MLSCTLRRLVLTVVIGFNLLGDGLRDRLSPR
jgi:ABC-type dipeptide/oligopeptide/nickel transport system permease subunit